MCLRWIWKQWLAVLVDVFPIPMSFYFDLMVLCMNHASITWPEGVEAGKPMLQVHDYQVVLRTCNLSVD